MPENDPPKGAPRDRGDHPYGPYVPAGGGGAGGNYVFTDMAHLDTIIARWQTLCERIEPHSRQLEGAARIVYPPADDLASQRQAEALIRSIKAARVHNESVLGYAKSYVQRLGAVRAEYGATEEANTDQFVGIDEDD